MRTRVDLLIDVAIASLVTTIGLFVPVLVVLLFNIPVPRRGEDIIGMMTAILPGSIGAWWMFRKLQTRYSRLEARAASIAFAIFTPIALGISILLAPLPGGIADLRLGPPFGLVGAVVGIFVMATLLSFGLCVIVLWVTRRIEGARPVQ
jgi:hypothetical protein